MFSRVRLRTGSDGHEYHSDLEPAIRNVTMRPIAASSTHSVMLGKRCSMLTRDFASDPLGLFLAAPSAKTAQFTQTTSH